MELTFEEAMLNREKHKAKKRKVSRSEGKQRADKKRVEKNESGSKKRKERIPCPEPGCKTTWANKKRLQDHLSEHDLKLFVCTICGKDYSREDNAITHFKDKHEDPKQAEIQQSF
ncbi:hypothetical protein TWF730_002985 [Orbilia blumenaviensis]|uniref:C2H2-type domain-containing protein n=1 Tax=Orbilia blumenaviensis TaxID=1796055 RepID=A0AAV9U7Q8_9PEZI